MSTGPPPQDNFLEFRERYAREGAHPVALDMDRCRELVPEVHEADLLARGNLVRHDSDALARFILRAAHQRTAGALIARTGTR